MTEPPFLFIRVVGLRLKGHIALLGSQYGQSVLDAPGIQVDTRDSGSPIPIS